MIPHEGNNNLIPDEVISGKSISLKHLRTFGCKCYYIDNMENKSNFTPKAKEGIFLGFSKKNYSYRIMDIKKQKNTSCQRSRMFRVISSKLYI